MSDYVYVAIAAVAYAAVFWIVTRRIDRSMQKYYGHTTTFHGLSSFRKYVCGKLTLAQYRRSRADIETKDL